MDFKLTDAKSPTLFSHDGYELVVMPMLTTEAKAGDKTEVKVETATGGDAEPAVTRDAETAQAVAEAEAIAKAEAKPKRSRKRDKVAVA